MEHKSFLPQIKRTDEGSALVVIATLGVKDRDGDILTPGAFGDQVVPVVGAHRWENYSIGKAQIRESGNEAVADIKFNDTDLGQNWYKSIRFDWNNPPPRQQYSWGFSLTSQNVKLGEQNGEKVRFLKAADDGTPIAIHELSPVLVGAGYNTRSLGVKSLFAEMAAELRDAGFAVDDPPPALPRFSDEELPGWEATEGDDAEAKQAFEIQSVLAYKSKWESLAAAKSWLSSHDFKTSDVDESESVWRFRQREPSRFARLRSICLNPGRDAGSGACRVAAVGGPMKEAASAETEPDMKTDQPGSFQSMVDEALAQCDRIVGRLEHFKLVRASEGRSLQPSRLEQARSLVQRLHALEEVVKDPDTDPADHGAAAALFDQFRSNHLHAAL